MSRNDPTKISDVKVMLVKGVNGSSIESIEKTGTLLNVDTYTITLTDGSKETFEVTNGVSITGIAKTGVSANVDTYTIYLSDGSTFSFTVTNGTDTNAQIAERVTSPAQRDYVKGEYVIFNDVLCKVVSPISTGMPFDTSINLSETTVGTELTAINGDISEISGDITDIEGDITDINGDITTIEGNVSTLNTNVGSLQTNVSALQTNVSSLNTNVNSVSSKLAGSRQATVCPISQFDLDTTTTVTATSNIKSFVFSRSANSDAWSKMQNAKQIMYVSGMDAENNALFDYATPLGLGSSNNNRSVLTCSLKTCDNIVAGTVAKISVRLLTYDNAVS